jgi:hypothetical protein
MFLNIVSSRPPGGPFFGRFMEKRTKRLLPPSTMKMRHPRKVTMHLSFKITGFAIALLLDSISSQFVFPPSSQPCPSGDISEPGYTSIEALTEDMNSEIERIGEGGEPQDSYFLILCPSTTFSTASEALMPILDGVTFSCGESGSITQGCVISGGDTNIRIEDSGVAGYQLEAMNFVGITFEGFTGDSIFSRATARTEAPGVVFSDCIWQVRLKTYLRLLPLGS